MRHVIAGTAGHIDHGKSALVLALTGTDPDRLKEEKLRGITIDLGFAHLDLGDVQVGFVDVPGHEKFVKNMLAGVGGIDFVLLVVAADESIMPQTREHFDICRLLGIPSGLVVITKTDLVDPDLVEVVREEIREMVQGSFLDGAPMIPVSSRTRAGIDTLKGEIRRLALACPERPTDHPLRLPIDRAFTIRGFGTVVTGTLMSGEIEKDQEVELIPGSLVTKVRGIQVHGTLTDRAIAGQRTAVNLQGIAVEQVERGIVLTIPRLFRPTQMLDVRLTLLATATHPLKNLVKVRFHQAATEVLARVALLGQDALAPGGSAYAQLRLDYPTFCLHGDPFIVRRFSPPVTIGGGRVLNPHPAKHRLTDRSVVSALQILQGHVLSLKIPILVAAHEEKAMDLRELNSLLGLSETVLSQECAALATSHRIIVVPGAVPYLLLTETVEQLEQDTLAQIKNFHGQYPLQKGISREELRKRVYDELPLEAFRFCLEDLAAKRKIDVQEETVSLHGREVQLSPEGEEVRQMIEEVYRRSGYQPPPLSELTSAVTAEPEEVRKIYFWLLKEKILIRISEDLSYHHHALEEIKHKIRSKYPKGARFGVAEFKDLLDLTRKHAIPLLEYLDREKFTRRVGNERVVL